VGSKLLGLGLGLTLNSLPSATGTLTFGIVTWRTFYYGDGTASPGGGTTNLGGGTVIIGGGTTTLGGGTLTSGGGTPDRGGGTPFRPVPAEFNHW